MAGKDNIVTLCSAEKVDKHKRTAETIDKHKRTAETIDKHKRRASGGSFSGNWDPLYKPLGHLQPNLPSLGGIFSDPLNKGSTIFGKISEHFSRENSELKKHLSRQNHSADVPP